MKRIDVLPLRASLLMILGYSSCSNHASTNSEPNNANDEAFFEAFKKGETSDVIERNLLSGFQIGQDEGQVDSVIKSLYDRKALVYFLEVNEDYGTIHSASDFDIHTSSIEYHIAGKTFYLNLFPEYINGKLDGLFCSIVAMKDQKLEKPIYMYFSDAFESSERGKEFHKFDNTFVDEETGEKHYRIDFIKDNLLISFYPQPDFEEGTIDYSNIPNWKLRAEAKQGLGAEDL